MSKFLENQMILLAKEETNYGDDASPTLGDNFIEAQNIKVNPMGEMLEQDLARTTLSPYGAVVGSKYLEISFRTRIKGSGTAGTAPKIGDLIEACGFSETPSVGSSVIYKPSTQSHKSVTIYVYELNQVTSGEVRRRIAKGCRGTPKFIFEAGRVAYIDWVFRGLFGSLADVTDPGDPTFDAVVPAVLESAALSYASVSTLIVQSVQIDLNNKIILQDNVSAVSGVGAFVITGREPKIAFNPLAELVATVGHDADWQASTKRALSMTLGATAGNKLTVSVPKIILDAPKPEAREGQVVDSLTGLMCMNAGNDELELKFW